MKCPMRMSVSKTATATFIFILVGALFPGSAQAAHPLITEDTGTQGRGNFQLELTAERGRDDANGARTKTVATAAVMAYGLRDDADMIFTLPRKRVHTDDGSTETNESGGSDAGLDFKWRFSEREDLSLALKPGVTLPTGDEAKGLGRGKSAYSLYLVTTIAPEPWALHLHMGYIRNRNVADERESIWHASFGGWREFGEKLKIVGDIGADTNTDKSSKTELSFLILGAIYSINKDFDADIGVKKGLTNTETDYTLLGGVTLRF